MGSFKAPEQKPAAKKNVPPAMPGQREALVKAEKGFVAALRADMQYVKASEVKKYAADRRAALVQESRDLNASGLPLSDRERGLNKVTAELKKLDELEAAADKAIKAGREGAYEGKEPLVENPFYQEKAEELGEADIIEVDEEATALANLEKQRTEIASLEKRKAELQKQIKQLMYKVKESTAEEDINRYMSEVAAPAPEEPAQFPNYFGKERPYSREESLSSVKDIEAASAREKRRDMADPLREMLDEMDEVNERLNALSRNVSAVESKYGKEKAA